MSVAVIIAIFLEVKRCTVKVAVVLAVLAVVLPLPAEKCQPQADVNVYFVPVDAGGSNGYAKTDENGFYKLQTLTGAAEAGTTPGKYKVKFDYQIREDDGTMMENGQEIPKYKSVSGLAKKWNNEETSGVEVEVVPGDNTFDFEITSK